MPSTAVSPPKRLVSALVTMAGSPIPEFIRR
jgi:hypothetical protein